MILFTVTPARWFSDIARCTKAGLMRLDGPSGEMTADLFSRLRIWAPAIDGFQGKTEMI
jgi:hypothetical protein